MRTILGLQRTRSWAGQAPSHARGRITKIDRTIHGALSTGTGRVDIGWGTDGERFVMGWTELEGPPVSTPQRCGFGTVVMKAMTERSVDGTVDLDYAPSGVTWRLTCPAANALGPNGDS